MKKKIWLTSLAASQDAVQAIIGTLTTYGCVIDGHFWEDDLDKMAWCKPRKELLEKDISMWLIYTGTDPLASISVRYGLALLALTVQAVRGVDFPIVFLQDGGEPIRPETLPTPFVGCSVLAMGTHAAKIVALLHKPAVLTFPDYRLDAYGIPQIGQWFEVGPRKESWQGMIFGTAPAGISMHAVGSAGKLPEKSTLNYAQKGIKLNIGQSEFDGWAVQNTFDAETSYYIKVDSHPESIVFCPYAQDDEADAYLIRLQ